jgi:hypothetical protein
VISLWAMGLRIHQQVSAIEERQATMQREQLAQRVILEAILKAVTPAEAVAIVLKLGVPVQQ